MKKIRKPSRHANEAYHLMLRKWLLNNLAWILLVVPFSHSLAADRIPTFIIFKDGVNLNGEIADLMRKGARIEKTVPPKVMVVHLPRAFSVDSIAGVQNVYRSAIPISQLEAMGPIVAAAGIQWNRELLRTARTSSSAGGFSSMSSAMSKASLPAPAGLTLSAQEATIRVEWKAIPGALYYDVQLARDPQFSNLMGQTKSETAQATMALTPPVVSPVYARIRSVDRSDPHDPAADIAGNWSAAGSATVSPLAFALNLPAPVLTSPVNGLESTGFSIALEWTGTASSAARIQMAKNTDFNTPVIDQIVSGQEYNVPSSMVHVGDRFYWRVAAWGTSASSWSDVREFVIGAPRPAGHDMFVNPEAPQ